MVSRSLLVFCSLAIALNAQAQVAALGFADAHTDFIQRARSTFDQRSSSDAAAFAARTYDYVIVGGGTAGLVVAARLSEKGDKTVAVIEAGQESQDDFIIDAPGMYGHALYSQYDWNYTSTASANAPSIHLARGKVLGGSSAINYLASDRATAIEYNAWESVGAKGWNWNNMLVAMKKSEDYTAPSYALMRHILLRPIVSFLGKNGPVSLSYQDHISELQSLWTQAMNSIGFVTNNNPSSGATIGAGWTPADIEPEEQKRSYAASAYYFPNANRKNLFVLTNAHATKINMATGHARRGTGASSLSYTAQSVEFTANGQTFTVKANKEVILSAGAMGTPQILELSGIGRGDVLSRAGVKQLIDLPGVGENYQDHLYVPVTYKLKNGHTSADAMRYSQDLFQSELKKWQDNSGPSLFGDAIGSLAWASLANLQKLAPDISSHFGDVVQDAKNWVTSKRSPYEASLKAQLAFLTEHAQDVPQVELIGINQYLGSQGLAKDTQYWTFLAAIMHPLSRGSIHISSSDPTVYSTVDANYLDAPFDRDMLNFAVQYIRKIAGASVFKNIIGDEQEPGAATTQKEQFDTYVKNNLNSVNHAGGTAAMLPENQQGVVDPNTLKVYHTTNLRVVDHSIIPFQLAAHPMNTVYGIGERGSQLILADP